jgi:hypothetical protein
VVNVAFGSWDIVKDRSILFDMCIEKLPYGAFTVASEPNCHRLFPFESPVSKRCDQCSEREACEQPG